MTNLVLEDRIEFLRRHVKAVHPCMERRNEPAWQRTDLCMCVCVCVCVCVWLALRELWVWVWVWV